MASEVRRARPADARELAKVHERCWQETYEGWLPEAYLTARHAAVREAFWTDVLEGSRQNVHVFVACDGEGRLCGFASGGPETTAALGADGELYSLYVLRSAQGRGLGRALTAGVLDALRDGGAQRVTVWVLSDNPARGFYEHLGGRRVAERSQERGGELFSESAYELAAGFRS